MSSGNFGCWAMKAGDFRASEFAGDLTGLTAAIAYAASGTGGDGVVSVFNSTTTPVAIPTIPVGVQVTVNEGGLRKTYSSGSLFPVSGSSVSGLQPAGNPTRYHYDPAWQNVREHGAKGDGVVDDAAAFMAAHTALPPTGGIIYVPNGDYLINSSLAFTKTVILEGTSHGNVQQTPAPCRILHGNLNFVGIVFSGAASQMKRIVFQGLASAVGVGVQIKNNSCSIEDVMVCDMGGTGIVFGEIGAAVIMNINHWTMIRVISRHNFGDGVHMEAFDSGGVPNCNVGTAINLSCYNNNAKGLRLVKAGKNTFIGYTGEINGQEGIYIEGLSDGNVFIGGDQEGNNGGSANTQIKVADGNCDDNVFFFPGILSSAGTPADIYPAGGASRSMLWDNGIAAPPPIARVGTVAFSNGPEMSNDIAGNSMGEFWNNSGLRLRVGLVQSAVPTGEVTPIVPAHVVARVTDSALVLASRDTAGGFIEMRAGSSASGQPIALLKFADNEGGGAATGYLSCNRAVKIGSVGSGLGRHLELCEMASAPAGAASIGKLFLRPKTGDATKNELVIQFETGTPVVIVAEA